MEHFKDPFSATDLTTPRALENQRFFEGMLGRARRHPFYSHPFMGASLGDSSPRIASFILGSYFKIVSPFTAHLCALSARAPTLRARYALTDNIYEELGCGDIDEAHPNLYVKMLASMGVSLEAAEEAPTLLSMQRTNEHLRRTIGEHPFAVGCALLASVEATIAPSFPVMALVGREAFPEMNMDFFDRHGPRDDEHCSDAATLFAVTAESSDFAAVEVAVRQDLDHRTETFDDWARALKTGIVPFHIGGDVGPRRSSSVKARTADAEGLTPIA